MSREDPRVGGTSAGDPGVGGTSAGSASGDELIPGQQGAAGDAAAEGAGVTATAGATPTADANTAADANATAAAPNTAAPDTDAPDTAASEADGAEAAAEQPGGPGGGAATPPEPVVTVTDRARRKVASLKAEEPGPGEVALWLEITGAVQGNYAYDMWFQALTDAGPEHLVQRHDDVSLVLLASDVDRLKGAVLDLNPNLLQGGMVITNPNRPPTLSPASPTIGGPHGELTGDVAQRVAQVLDTQVNPAIASHGGFAELVGVEDDAAYLRLSGGCQGCGMATVTLSQGIEVAIKESVPEIVRVVDVTDHAGGTNPFFEPAKK